LTYTNLINNTIKIYLAGDYKKAYAYITKYEKDVTGNLAQIYNFRYAIASKAGMADKAIELMAEAIIDCGFWYASEYLQSDEDLDLIRKNETFDSLVCICEKREKVAKNQIKPQLKILSSQLSESHPEKQLIMALHGNQENLKIAESYWKCLLTEERLIALPQSSEIEFSDAYIWEDLEIGSHILEDFYKKIVRKEMIKKDELIYGGFSAGARQVLYQVLFTQLKAKGLILIAPWLPELEEWKKIFSLLSEKRIKIYIICGDKDEDSYEDSKALAGLLNTFDIDHRFVVIENLEHDYPNEFSRIIEKGIQYINA